jgi:hypothetical protein
MAGGRWTLTLVLESRCGPKTHFRGDADKLEREGIS